MNLKLTVALKTKIVDLFTAERRDIAELAHVYGKTGLQIEGVLREALAARNRAETNGEPIRGHDQGKIGTLPLLLAEKGA